MTTEIWLPALVVLAVGLGAGFFIARRFRRQGPSVELSASRRDLELRVEDLEERRNDIYRRLREEGELLQEDEKEALELAAARTLRDLDRARAELKAAGAPSQRAPETAAAEAPSRAATPAAAPKAGFARRHPLLAGSLFGVAMALTVGVLIYFALRDATPREDAGPPPPAADQAERAHRRDGELPTQVRQEIDSLRARLAAEPGDLRARKELALLLLSHNQFLEAFQLSEEILGQAPEDPDGLYIQGVVRVTMGQNEQALDLLDRILARFPEHLSALLYRGIALAQMGRLEQAVDTWEMGLEQAGGTHPDFEQLLRMAAEGAFSATPAAAVAPAAAEPASEQSYLVRMELGAGARVEAGSVLFLSLLESEGDAPVAVRRVASPSFPLELALDGRHSMMGDELPRSGILVARIDSDGDVTSVAPTDLRAEAPGSMGTTTRIVLEP